MSFIVFFPWYQILAIPICIVWNSTEYWTGRILCGVNALVIRARCCFYVCVHSARLEYVVCLNAFTLTAVKQVKLSVVNKIKFETNLKVNKQQTAIRSVVMANRNDWSSSGAKGKTNTVTERFRVFDAALCSSYWSYLVHETIATVVGYAILQWLNSTNREVDPRILALKRGRHLGRHFYYLL